MFYSKSTGGFYCQEINGDNIPADSVEISDAEHAALLQAQSGGKQIAADENGYPVLIDLPAPTPDELSRQAQSKKKALIAEASAVIAPLADAQAGGYIDDADVPRLDKWQRYRYELTKVDTSIAPTISWPVPPEV